ncbi:MAG: 2Fe-2S iron-sulfur cluster binding domain-containing protein [Methylococcales bacterium]|nr:2Fe-2S iron-sulfur cluster binding domain-containing protein [Methylococcales bacterium]MCK5905473.1 2Fe-2S iron-sulfur cluster binding domain-containing protein [Gammaproteobacteria bacterium]
MAEHKIQLDDQHISCQPDESILNALLREKVDISYGCQQGVCQSCMMRSLDSPPPSESQNGLTDQLKEQNYFLACLCYPQQTMRIGRRDHTDFITHGTVSTKKNLNSETILLTLDIDDPLNYYAGQFVNLQREDGLIRSYSIANNSIHSKQLTFHIRRLPGGQFSEWAHQELKLGDRIALSEPQGLCYYQADNLEQPLLLIGTGSGLAPLAGIISEALHQGHTGDISLYHGSRDETGLYWVEEMQELTNKHTNFHYTPCISKGEPPRHIAAGRANDVAFKALTDLKGYRIYLCGHPDMVNSSKRQAFMNGASLSDIYADAFHVVSNSSE